MDSGYPTPEMLARSIVAKLGIQGDSSLDPLVMRLEPYDEVCHRGVLLASVVVLLVDMVAGMLSERGSGTDWVFTSDLSVQVPAAPPPRELVGSGSLLRVGRSTVSSEVTLLGDGAPWGYGVGAFVRLPRRHGDPPKPHQNIDKFERPPSLDQPLLDAVGIDVIDGATGSVTVELRDELRNPAGAMQGGMVSLVAETAALALADATIEHETVVTGLDIRYLAMGRVGPVTSSALWAGPPSSGAIRVHLHDEGNGGRLMTSVLARIAPAPVT